MEKRGATVIVLDCSLVLASVLPDEDSSHARNVIKHTIKNEMQVTQPPHFMLEYSNGLLMARRRQRITLAEARRLLAHWQGMPVDVDNEAAAGELFVLAEKHGLTIYDAAYLELAIRRDAVLATLDKPLAKAARQEKVALL